MNYAKTAYLEKALLDHVLKNVEYTSPTTVYLALFTDDPGRNGDLSSEVSDPSYVRQPVTFTSAADNEVSGSYSQNSAIVEFPAATVNWGVITHAMVMDSQTEGNGLYRMELDVHKDITINDIARFPIGSIKIIED